MARRQAEDPVLTDVVRLRAHALGQEPAVSLRVLLANRTDHGVWHGLADLVRDTAGDHRTAEHANVDVVSRLAFSQHYGLRSATRPRLSIGPRDERRLGDADGVSAGREVADLITAFGVGGRGSRDPCFLRAHAD